MTLLSGLTYETFKQTAEDSFPRGLWFSPDESRMVMSGVNTHRAYSYTGTPGSISTFTYDSKSFLFTTEGTAPAAVAFNPDGTLMYAALDVGGGPANDGIYQYDLTAWDVTTAVYSTKRLLIGLPVGLHFKPDGTEAYVVESASVKQYTLSSAWDISAGTLTATFSVAGQTGQVAGVTLDSTGTIMLVLGGDNDTIFEYTLTAWDLSSASYTSDSLSVNAQDSIPTDIHLTDSKLYMVGQVQDRVHQWARAVGGWRVGMVSMG